MNWDDVEIINQAVQWIAEFGWRFLPAYRFVPETGEWEHRTVKPLDTRSWLSQMSFVPNGADNELIFSRLKKNEEEEERIKDAKVGQNVAIIKKDPRKVAGAEAIAGCDSPRTFQKNM